MDAMVIQANQWCLAAVLLTAGLSKVRYFEQFCHSVSELLALPGHRAKQLSGAVVLGELLLAVCFLFEWGAGHYVGWAAAALLFCFTALLIIKFQQGQIVRCSCFGNSDRPVSGIDIGRNILLIASAVTVAVSGWQAVPWTNQEAWLALAISGWLTVVLVYLHEIVSLLLGRFEDV